MLHYWIPSNIAEIPKCVFYKSSSDVTPYHIVYGSAGATKQRKGIITYAILWQLYFCKTIANYELDIMFIETFFFQLH